MAVKRLRTVLADVAHAELIQSRPRLKSAREIQEHTKSFEDTFRFCVQELSKKPSLEKIEELDENNENVDVIMKKTSAIKKRRLFRSKKKRKARVSTPIDKTRMKTRSLRIRQKQADETCITIPEGMDQKKLKWRKYLNLFRKDKVKTQRKDIDEIKSRLNGLKPQTEAKKKPTVLEKLRNVFKKRNKVAPIPIDVPNIQLLELSPPIKQQNSSTVNANLPITTEKHETTSLMSVSPPSSVCNSTTSLQNGFAEGKKEECSSSENKELGNKNNESQINTAGTEVVRTKEFGNEVDEMQTHCITVSKHGIENQQREFNIAIHEMAEKLLPKKSVAMEIDITGLRTKANKPLSDGKKKEKDPFELDMKMIVAEQNRNTYLDGRVTPLKQRHEKIAEVNLFNSCESELEKKQLKEKIAEKEANYRRRKEELLAKQSQERRAFIQKFQRKLEIKSMTQNNNEAKACQKLPCYFEIPVNMDSKGKKPVPRPESSMSRRSTKENCEKALANRNEQIAKKQMKLKEKHERVKTVCEQMKMLPPRNYGDNEYPSEQGDDEQYPGERGEDKQYPGKNGNENGKVEGVTERGEADVKKCGTECAAVGNAGRDAVGGTECAAVGNAGRDGVSGDWSCEVGRNNQ